MGGYVLEKLVITGNTPLKGEVIISGAKNAAVAIIPATLLINGVCTIENLPNISDVKLYCDILKSLGSVVTWNSNNEVTIDNRNINSSNAPLDITSKFRASYYLIGTTIIDNAAKEPHIVDVANFLNTMGADIRGAGTYIIKINGVKELKGNATYSIVPDQIEAGTFMLAAVASKGDIIVKN